MFVRYKVRKSASGIPKYCFTLVRSIRNGTDIEQRHVKYLSNFEMKWKDDERRMDAFWLKVRKRLCELDNLEDEARELYVGDVKRIKIGRAHV